MKSLPSNQQSDSMFDGIRHLDEQNNEFWLATELLANLGYTSWKRIKDTVERAKVSALNSKADIASHFADVVQMAQIGGSQAFREVIKDFKLSRYACYLVAMNGDPRKTEIAQAQTYFVCKAREGETVIPQQDVRIRELELQLALAKEQNKLADSQSKLLATVHLLETVSPGLAPLALGKSDAVIERVEYVERTITPNAIYEGVGIGYIRKRLGFKTDKQAWAWLDSIGYGKHSGIWELQLTAVEHHKLPPHLLNEVVKKFAKHEGDRQLLLGE